MLGELRLLAATEFDSRIILTVVLAGDERLSERLRRDALVPLGSRIRIRMKMDYAEREVLYDCLEHLLKQAGNPQLMTKQLKATLCDHASGNYRIMTTMADNLLAVATERQQGELDEKLYFEVFDTEPKRQRRR